MKTRHAAALLSAFGLFLLSPTASAWFAEGHEIAAIIAADDLTPTARSHVAQILGVPAEAGSVEKARSNRSSIALSSVLQRGEFQVRLRGSIT
jgi:hypothetical protein